MDKEKIKAIMFKHGFVYDPAFRTYDIRLWFESGMEISATTLHKSYRPEMIVGAALDRAYKELGQKLDDLKEKINDSFSVQRWGIWADGDEE